MEEVSGKVVRVEDYGAFVEFQWNNKALTGLLSRDEMKVPSSALSEEAQAELRAEWADTEFEMPAYADLPDNQLDVKKYYAVGQEVRARNTLAYLPDPAAASARGCTTRLCDRLG